jgi:hypothetical protein
VASGFILLVLIGILVGFGWTRIRRKAGVGVTWQTWATVIAGVVILGLLAWATQVKH